MPCRTACQALSSLCPAASLSCPPLACQASCSSCCPPAPHAPTSPRQLAGGASSRPCLPSTLAWQSCLRRVGAAKFCPYSTPRCARIRADRRTGVLLQGAGRGPEDHKLPAPSTLHVQAYKKHVRQLFPRISGAPPGRGRTRGRSPQRTSPAEETARQQKNCRDFNHPPPINTCNYKPPLAAALCRARPHVHQRRHAIRGQARWAEMQKFPQSPNAAGNAWQRP